MTCHTVTYLDSAGKRATVHHRDRYWSIDNRGTVKIYGGLDNVKATYGYTFVYTFGTWLTIDRCTDLEHA